VDTASAGYPDGGEVVDRVPLCCYSTCMADDSAPRIPRARPVADLPLERLEAQAEQLARRWGAQLVISRPLATLGQVSLAALARQGPELCGQMLRALSSDAELERLLAGERTELGAPYPERPASLAGAHDAASVVDTVESLRGVLWEAVQRELAGGFADAARERLVGDASDRLAHVCAALAAAAAERTRPSVETRPARFPERPPAPRHGPEGRITIVDEREAAHAGVGAAREQHREVAAEPDTTTRERPSPAPRLPAQIAIRDTRSEQGPAAWIHSIGQRLERFAVDGDPFAVVLLEAAAAGAEQALAQAEIESALSAELRDAGGATVTRERAGRYWLVMPRADRPDAQAVAARLKHALVEACARIGASVTVATGTAVCPEDGSQAAALAAHADVGLYAGRWESRSAAAREEEGL
jgi:hypothetical protein